MLGWFAGKEHQFNPKELLAFVDGRAPKVSEIEVGVTAELLEFLNDAASREYVFNQCCAAISHAFSGGGYFLNDDILNRGVQMAFLKFLHMPLISNRSYVLAVEDIDMSDLDARSRLFYLFAEQASFILVREFKKLLFFVPGSRELGRRSKLMVCYLEGMGEEAKMRIDCVTDDSEAGDKFGVNLLARHRQGQLVLPEQLRLAADG
ncbi:hypothetical protein B6S59_30710 [Pseudomonas sp. A46]|nr:hypothetical protein B6S59_30710 [Pseudomonas sp. A46]